MKNEMLKGLAMIVLVVALAVTTAAVTNAQSANSVVADVPFEFSVGYKSLPAGQIRVQIVTSASDALLIQTGDGKASAFRMSEATNRMKDKTHARLVFHRYGERYFLAEVWNGTDTGRQLLRSQEESAMERELTSIASTSDQPHASYEVVEVIAKLR